MRARSTDGEESLTAANDQDRFSIRLSGNWLSLFQRRAGYPVLREVRTADFDGFTHGRTSTGLMADEILPLG
jgi:hypothetical protein